MQKTITTLIPQYGELNRICKDWIISHTFSFEKQKFIVDFYSEWNDITAFEQAILELVLHTPPEPCTLLLKSLKKEVREYTRLYESYRLPNDEVIMRVCNQYADSYKEAIREEMEVLNRLRKPMNEANTASVSYFSPGNLRRRVSRPVSYYALFKWVCQFLHVFFHLAVCILL